MFLKEELKVKKLVSLLVTSMPVILFRVEVTNSAKTTEASKNDEYLKKNLI